IAGPVRTSPVAALEPPVRDGRILVFEGERGPESLVSWMDFDGRIVERTDVSWAQFRQERAAGGRGKSPPRFQQARWLRQFAQWLHPHDAAAAKAAQQSLRAGVAELREEAGDEPAPDDIAAAALATAPGYLSFDWKDDSALQALRENLPDFGDALAGYHWNPADNGEDIASGIEAARAHLAGRGHGLVEIETHGDDYAILVVPQDRLEPLLALCRQAQLTVRTGTEPR
ncbi:MAG: hypothetical protein QM586_10670, partial [Xenophilus sp.]